LVKTPTFDSVSQDLVRVEQKMRQALETSNKYLTDILFYILDSGGKRIRPALALLATKFGTVNPAEKAIALAAAIEMLHTATLVHDDLIDNSLLRRGKTTINAHWNSGATVLAGDLMFAQAAALAAETQHVRVISLFANTLGIICRGELAQLFAPPWNEQNRTHYYDRIYSKTASLLETAAQSGAILASLPEDQIASLREYGRNLGMAFQLIDDVLDFVGDEHVLGKPVGSDLRQGTVTLPAMYFVQQNPDDELMLRVLNRQEQDPDAIAEVVTRIAQSEAIQTTVDEAREFIRQGKAALHNLPDHPSKDALLSIADFVVEREL